MKLAVAVRLFAGPDRAAALHERLERCDAQCDGRAERGAEADVRRGTVCTVPAAGAFAFAMVCRHSGGALIVKVAAVFKLGDRGETRRCVPYATEPCDGRIFGLLRRRDGASIWRLAGHQRPLPALRGQVCLCSRAPGGWRPPPARRSRDWSAVCAPDHVIAEINLAGAGRDCCFVLEGLRRIRDRVQAKRQQRAQPAKGGFGWRSTT